jgi:hypothetical protein
MAEETVQRVLALVSKHRGAEQSKSASLASTLRDDLRMDGDDAIEFFEEFAAEFDVDLSAFVFDKYFGPEGGFLPAELLSLARKRTPKEPITIARLVAAAEAGRWSN